MQLCSIGVRFGVSVPVERPLESSRNSYVGSARMELGALLRSTHLHSQLTVCRPCGLVSICSRACVSRAHSPAP